MAADPESLDVELAAAVFREMGEMMEEETRLRKSVQEMVRDRAQWGFLYKQLFAILGKLYRMDREGEVMQAGFTWEYIMMIHYLTIY